MRIAALALFLLSAAALPSRAATVDVALVLAVDVSESVDDGRYELQHEGIARAFENPQLAAAIRGGTHGVIDVLVLEWSDRDQQAVTVDWTPVKDKASAEAFAARVRASKRTSAGRTAIGDALAAAKLAFDRLPDKADRRVIDLSGDGIANIGPAPQDVRDLLVAEGIVINGLAILETEPWLDQYYDANVVGGAGGFLMQVDSFENFGSAMLNKLLTEIVMTTSPAARRHAALPLRLGQMQ